MNDNERRKYPRVDTSNLLECCCLDENENELDNFMVLAVDVSPIGLKIQSFQKIESEFVRMIAVDSDDALMESRGKIAHSREIEAGRYEYGICFTGFEPENTRFALKLIGLYHQAEPCFVMVKGSVDADGERRKYSRLDAHNLISFICVDENNAELNQCMARALDVNPLGAKLETYQEIVSENIRLTTFDEKGNLIEISGRVVHTHLFDDGRCEFGVRFLGADSENTDFALKLIDVCHKVEPAFVMVKRPGV